MLTQPAHAGVHSGALYLEAGDLCNGFSEFCSEQLKSNNTASRSSNDSLFIFSLSATDTRMRLVPLYTSRAAKGEVFLLCTGSNPAKGREKINICTRTISVEAYGPFISPAPHEPCSARGCAPCQSLQRCGIDDLWTLPFVFKRCRRGAALVHNISAPPTLTAPAWCSHACS